jgi:hypothetical protein
MGAGISSLGGGDVKSERGCLTRVRTRKTCVCCPSPHADCLRVEVSLAPPGVPPGFELTHSAARNPLYVFILAFDLTAIR